MFQQTDAEINPWLETEVPILVCDERIGEIGSHAMKFRQLQRIQIYQAFALPGNPRMKYLYLSLYRNHKENHHVVPHYGISVMFICSTKL